MTTRARVPYFNVPASQQPLRVRAKEIRRPPRPQSSEYISPLEQLIVCNAPRVGSFLELDERDIRLEMLDAANEDRWGRLPHEPGFGIAPICSESSAFATSNEAVELIPEWVLADARELLAGGMTLQKVASAILPATDCADLPSCQEILHRQLGVGSPT